MMKPDQSPSLERRKNSFYEPSRILVGVTGGSAAGKTTLSETIRREIQYDSDVDMSILSLDCFYRGVDKTKYDIAYYNFDHPDALDFDLAYETIQTLLSGKPAKVPVYCFVTHSRLDKYIIIMPCQVIVFEGILALYDERIRALMSYKIFIHCDDDIRLCRRILRDVNERGRTVESVLSQYNRFVKSSYDDFIAPSMSVADIIIPGSRDNHISVSFIVNNLKNLAKQLGILRDKQQAQVYFGDILYQIEGFMRVKQGKSSDYLTAEQKPQKQLFFPTEEGMKEEYLYLVQNLLGGKLTQQKQIYKVIKQCHKLTYQLLDKALQQEKLDYSNIQCVNLLNIQDEKNPNSLNVDSIEKEYILLTTPILLKKGMDFIYSLAQTLKKKQKSHIKLIIINVFTDIKILKELVDYGKIIKLVCNAFLIGSIDKLSQLLLCDEPNLQYQQNKFFEKTNKHLQKLQRRQQLEKENQNSKE